MEEMEFKDPTEQPQTFVMFREGGSQKYLFLSFALIRVSFFMLYITQLPKFFSKKFLTIFHFFRKKFYPARSEN